MSEMISPEERLFKVIQQGKLVAGQGRRDPEKKNGGWLEGFKRFIPSSAVGTAGAIAKEDFLVRIKWPELEPENINKVLAVVLGAVLVFVVYVASSKHKDVAMITDAAAKIGALPGEGEKKIETLKELSFYLNAIRKRDVFRASTGAPVASNVQKISESLSKTTESMKLQGISWGDVPKAMILVQNDKDSKMYFLVEGQAIGTTGLRVTEISRSNVKISDGKEETVLL
ncbi:MAG: hypothetical protein V1882_00025 [Candidatus Omnitrophota bacterium]